MGIHDAPTLSLSAPTQLPYLVVDSPLTISGTLGHADSSEAVSVFIQYYETDQVFAVAAGLTPGSSFTRSFTPRDHPGWPTMDTVRFYARDSVGLCSSMSTFSGVVFLAATATNARTPTKSASPPASATQSKTPPQSRTPVLSRHATALAFATRRATQSPRRSRSPAPTATPGQAVGAADAGRAQGKRGCRYPRERFRFRIARSKCIHNKKYSCIFGDCCHIWESLLTIINKCDTRVVDRSAMANFF
jgi:hypothetical protein